MQDKNDLKNNVSRHFVLVGVEEATIIGSYTPSWTTWCEVIKQTMSRT